MEFFEKKNKIWRILGITIGIILIAFSVLLLLGVIGYVAIETEKENKALISGIAGVVAVNAIITLINNFFPSENKELKELKELNQNMQKIIELKEQELLKYENINKLKVNENDVIAIEECDTDTSEKDALEIK